MIYWWVLRRIIRAIEWTIDSIRNLTSLTENFQIIICQMDWNRLFHTLNNLAFGGQYSAEEIRNNIWTFLISKKNLYENLWEGHFDTHIRNLKINGFWGINLEIMIFSDMIRLNICLYTSLDQNFTEVEINHLHNIGSIKYRFLETRDIMMDYKNIKRIVIN